MTSEDRTKTKASRGTGWIAGGGAVSGFAALIGASCCALPLLLVHLGISAALVGKLAFFARAQPYFMTAAIILIGAGVTASFWKGRRPGVRVFVTLLVAGVLVFAAYIMPRIEPHLLHWMIK